MNSPEPAARKPFRAVEVLSGRIDQRAAPVKPPKQRKQISAQLEPEQVRLLGELHARLNATASERIEKSDLVGLGIELLAAVLDERLRDGELDPGSDRSESGIRAFASADDVRAYVRTHVRGDTPPHSRTGSAATVSKQGERAIN